MSSTNTNTWLTDPVEAHTQWRRGLVVADRAYAEQSQRLYLSLFGRFCSWLRTQQRQGEALTLTSVQAPDIGLFLDELKGRADKPASARTRRTYLAEIDRVLQHLKGIGLRESNPANTLLEQAKLIAPLKPRSINLPAADMPRRFELWVGDLEREASLPAHMVQSICMALLMLECGLTLKELQKLLLAHIQTLHDKATITSPGHRTIMPRTLTLSPMAVRWLLRWLDTRRTLRVVARARYDELRQQLKDTRFVWGEEADRVLARHKPRQALFVHLAGHHSERGTAKGLRALGLATDLVGDRAIYQAAEDAVFALSDADAQERQQLRHKGPQALRNLCCARLMVRGVPVTEIAQVLGLRRNDQVWAMGRQLKLVQSAG